MAITVSAVNTAFGAYYLGQPDNMARLRAYLYQKAQTAAYFQDRPTDDTIWRGTLASLDRVIQPFQKAWTPIGTVTFTPNTFPLYKIKIDKEETPDDIESTYLGYLANLPELDRGQWPFVRWFIENHVLPKSKSDLELNEYWQGVYAAPTPGTAGAASTAMNGLKTIIRAYNTAALTNLGTAAYATGASSATPATWVGQVESFVDDIPDVIRTSIDYVFMSKTNAIKYKRGKAIKYGAQVNFLEGGQSKTTLEDYPEIQVVGLASMGSSDMIWATPPDNRIRPLKKAVLADTMRVESLKRSVFMYTDWWEALNFETPSLVFTNDQDLAD